MRPLDPNRASAPTGHVFNMLHDNSKPCVGLNGPGSTSRHVMAPVMAHVDPEEPWSPCSARFITDFLDNGYGKQMALPFPCAGPSSCPHCTFSSAAFHMGQIDSFQCASSAVWDGVRNAAAFVRLPLPLRTNSTATRGKFWLNRIRTDLLRATTIQHWKGLVVKGGDCFVT